MENGKDKVQPSQLSIDAFISTGLPLVRCFAGSPEHSSTLPEYIDYLNFMNVKKQYYLFKAVLEFDNDYRNSQRMRAVVSMNTKLAPYELTITLAHRLLNAAPLTETLSSSPNNSVALLAIFHSPPKVSSWYAGDTKK